MILDVGLHNYDLPTVASYASNAEAVGYGALWTTESQHDPFLPLAVAATSTTSLQLGTAIALAFIRSPMEIAYVAWDLQKASAGRFLLGLGTQVKAHNERRFAVKFESPARKLREIVLALRTIWNCWQTGLPLHFKGEFYSFSLMTPTFNPGPIPQPEIPIYLAAVNPIMCRVSGEVADGIHMHPFHTVKYLKDHVRPNVEKGLRASDRSTKNFVFATAAFVVIGDSESERSESAEAVKQKIAFYASTRTYEPVLAVHGWEGILPELHRKSIAGDWKGMTRLITDEMLDAVAVYGTYENIGKRLQERYAGIADRIRLYFYAGSEVSATAWPRLHALPKQFRP